MIGPDGQPPTFTGAAWVSRDGRYFWNGTAWQQAARKRRPSLVLIGIGVVIVAGVALAIRTIPGPTDSTPYGMSNPRIVSSSEIQFDYRSATSCSNLTFDYKFFNSSGAQVQELQDESGSAITAGRTYHFTIEANAGQSIDPKATTFTAFPTCHS